MYTVKILSLTFFLSFFILNQNSQAQVNVGDAGAQASDLVKDFRLNFTIPDAPAFKLIDVDKSKILRPTSVRELGVVVSDFTGADNSILTIPKAFAVEFSPALLLSGSELTLRDYQTKPALYRLRISGATKRLQGESGPSQIAFGLRVSLIDESDLRRNQSYINSVTRITGAINEIYTQARKRAGPPPNNKIVLTPQEEEMVNNFNKKIKEDWTEEKWNANVFDIAFALRAMSSDSTGKSLEMDKYSFWATYGNGLGTTGQWLLGGNAGFERDSTGADFKFDWSLSSRIYIGANKFKGFVEAQAAKMESKDLDFLLNSGAEVTIGKDVWLVFSAGAERNGETDDWNVVSNFKFKVGFPSALQ
jgi:hypothetical protein